MSTTIPLTINLPQELVNASEELIKAGKVKNFDEFIATAVQNELLKNNLSGDSLSDEDPIFGLGKNPVNSGIIDASNNLDNYIYNS
jgi:Arc/MetJ-type ribon-helix-helix transcriptional regulator